MDDISEGVSRIHVDDGEDVSRESNYYEPGEEEEPGYGGREVHHEEADSNDGGKQIIDDHVEPEVGQRSVEEDIRSYVPGWLYEYLDIEQIPKDQFMSAARVADHYTWDRLREEAGAIRNSCSQHVPPLVFGGADGNDGRMSEDKLYTFRILTYLLGISVDDLELNIKATTGIRKLLSMQEPPITPCLKARGLLKTFIQYLSSPSSVLQFEALWALTNLVSGNSDETRQVIEAGVLPAVSLVLRHNNNLDVAEQAVWLLGNVAGDSAQHRDLVLRQCPDAMTRIIQLNTAEAKISFMRNSAWTLSNMCRGKPAPAFDLVSPCIPLLQTFILHNDQEIQADACWALSYLTDGPNEMIDRVIRNHKQIVPRLAALLASNHNTVKIAALRTLGNIVTGDDQQTEIVLSAPGFMQNLVNLLDQPKVSIRKEACWTFSNITAGNQSQIQRVLDAGCVPKFIDMMQRDRAEIQKEACWTVTNITAGGSQQQMRRIIDLGAIKALCHVLVHVSDVRVKQVSVEGLYNLTQTFLKNPEESTETGGTSMRSYFSELDQDDVLDALNRFSENNDSSHAREVLSVLGYEEEDDGEN